MITVNIEYFAVFREERGLKEECVQTDSRTLAAFYEEQRSKYHFSMPQERVRVAINDEFKPWNDCLKENDKVVFIAPVAGG